MRILFVSANSADAYMDIEREHRTLQRLADSSGHSLRVLPAAEITDLQEALQLADKDECYDVLHFSGHIAQDRGLELRGKGRVRDVLGGEALKTFLTGTGVKLVVLNACQSEWLAVQLSEVVPAAIGTTRKVRDVAARQFTRDFYAALMDEVDAGTAFDMALRRQKQSATPGYMYAGIRRTESAGELESRAINGECFL